jgi:hypothetical protein
MSFISLFACYSLYTVCTLFISSRNPELSNSLVCFSEGLLEDRAMTIGAVSLKRRTTPNHLFANCVTIRVIIRPRWSMRNRATVSTTVCGHSAESQVAGATEIALLATIGRHLPPCW